MVLVGALVSAQLGAVAHAEPAPAAAAERSRATPAVKALPTVGQLPVVPLVGYPVLTGDSGLVRGANSIVSWNGAVWFAMEAAGKVGRIDPAGTVSEYSTGSYAPPGSGPRKLSTASSGSLWLVANGSPLDGTLLRLSSTPAVTAVHDVAGYMKMPTLAARSDGGAWVLYGDGEGASVINANGTEVAFFEAPRYDYDSEATLGSGDSLWFNEGGSTLKRLDDSGTLVNYPATGDGRTISSLTTTSAGIWYSKFNPGTTFTYANGGMIGRIGSDGLAVTFPGPVTDMVPNSLTPAYDGGVWFTVGQSGIGHLSAGGAYRLVRVPDGTSADAVTEGPDGNLWVVDTRLNRIHKILRTDFDAAAAGGVTQPPTAQLLAPQVAVKAPRRAVAGARTPFRVNLTRADGVVPTGTVRFKVSMKGGKRKGRTQVRTAKLVDGRASVRLRLKRPGRATVRMTYSGDAANKAVTKKVTVRVVKKRRR